MSTYHCDSITDYSPSSQLFDFLTLNLAEVELDPDGTGLYSTQEIMAHEFALNKFIIFQVFQSKYLFKLQF